VLENLVRNKKHTKTISITSGKGGVGKTTLTCNLARYLSLKGKKVLILDGDLGMANVDIMFGKRANYSILDVINGDKFIEEVIQPLSESIYLIPGGSGLHELSNMNVYQKQNLLEQVSSLTGYFDYLLIDTAPGIDSNVLYLNAAVNEIVVLVNPDPASLTDSYALIKVLNKYHKEDRFTIVCNEVNSEHEAKLVFQKLSEVCEKFLCVSLDYKGFIPTDQSVHRATRSQSLVLDKSPYSPAAKSIMSVAEALGRDTGLIKVKGGLQFFWEQVLGVA